MKNMRNLSIDFANRAIIVTQAFVNRAGNVDSEEYRELVQVIQALPTFDLQIKPELIRNAHQSPVKRLTYKQMEAFIMQCPDAEEREALLADFYEIRRAGEYLLTKKWFLKTKLIERFSAREAA